MKKVAVILIVIAAAVAIFAVVAGQNDVLQSAETEKTSVEKKVDQQELKKNVKIPLKAIKMPKLNINREQFKNMQKYKEKKEKTPDSGNNSESCGG
ncbi:hypothetical protein J5690_02270 [bacterium]|nr:hypothetical protein [bacterium]